MSGRTDLVRENRPELVNGEIVSRLRAAGIDEIHIWTVDESHQVRHYQRLGVTSITTNRPAAFCLPATQP